MHNIHILFQERDSTRFLCLKKREDSDKWLDIYHIQPYTQDSFCYGCLADYQYDFVFSTNDNLS